MINILICANAKYLKIATTTLYSIRCHTAEPIHCFVCQKGVEQKELSFFSKQLRKNCIESTVIEFGQQFDEEELINAGGPVSIETFYRLFAQFFLPKNLDRILYLDADIVALGDVSSFYHQDFEGKYIIACQDFGDAYGERAQLKEKIGMAPNDIYVNAGVALLNLTALREAISMTDIFSLIFALKDKWVFLDQDVLNSRYRGKIKFVSSTKYNMHDMNVVKLKKTGDTVLLHYAGAIKPWSLRGILDTNSHFYWEYLLKQYPLAFFRFLFVRVLGGQSYRLYRFIKCTFFKKG